MTKQISKILSSKLKSITAFSLILAIFLANTGFVLSSHLCKMRGEKTSMHLFSPKKISEDKCCSKTSTETSEETSTETPEEKSEQEKNEKDKCCSFSAKYIKADIQQNTPVFGVDFAFISPIILENFAPKFFLEKTFYVKRKPFFTFYNKPPPISNRILLCLYGILRI